MITMLLGGSGMAAWPVIVWGAWHGLLLVLFHALKGRGLVPSNDRPAGYWFNRQLTFLLVVVGWVFFRAADVRAGEYGLPSISLPAFRMLGEMIGLRGLVPASGLASVPVALWCRSGSAGPGATSCRTAMR